MALIPPHPYSNELRGRIFQFLLTMAYTTRELSLYTNCDYRYMQRELMRLSHLGAVEPIAVVEEGKSSPLYDQELVWQLTDHALTHNRHIDGCQACKIRWHLMTYNVR